MGNDIRIYPGSSSIQFSGSAANRITLQTLPSGSVAFLGTSGSLFQIDDDLSGSLMSVNDVSGLPILEVFSNNIIVAGAFNQNDWVISGSRVGIGTPTASAKLQVIGNIVATSITSSLQGTASWAISASWAPNSGGGTTLYTASLYQITASQAQTSSWAISASWAPGSEVGSAASASWASSSLTASYLNGTASYAYSASWAPGSTAPDYTSSLWGTASWAQSASWAPVGVSTFLGLSDTPDSYVGRPGEIVMVNTASTGLVFGGVPTGVIMTFSETGSSFGVSGSVRTSVGLYNMAVSEFTASRIVELLSASFYISESGVYNVYMGGDVSGSFIQYALTISESFSTPTTWYSASFPQPYIMWPGDVAWFVVQNVQTSSRVGLLSPSPLTSPFFTTIRNARFHNTPTSYGAIASDAYAYGIYFKPYSRLSPYGVNIQTGSLVPITSSWALSASWAPGSTPTDYTSSLWGTASWAQSASWAPGASTSDSSSWASQSFSASYSETASIAFSSSWALSASWAPGSDAGSSVSSSWASQSLSSSWAQYAVTYSFVITSSQADFASSSLTADFALLAGQAISASYAPGAPPTSSWANTSSWAVSASWAPGGGNTDTASWAITASYAMNGGTGGGGSVALYASSSLEADIALLAWSAISSSYALTSSWAVNTVIPGLIILSSSYWRITSSWADTASLALSFFTGSSLYLSGSQGNIAVRIISDVNSYSEINVQNIDHGVSASSDIVATSDSGSDSSYYIDMGINGGNYAMVDMVGRANDAYLYMTGSNVSDLYVGNVSPNGNTYIFAGGFNNTGSGFVVRRSTITASLPVQGVFSGSFSGSLYGTTFGTASWSTTASFAHSASLAQTALNANTSSWAISTVIPGLIILTSSYWNITASISDKSITSSFAQRAGIASASLISTSASYARTSSLSDKSYTSVFCESTDFALDSMFAWSASWCNYAETASLTIVNYVTQSQISSSYSSGSATASYVPMGRSIALCTAYTPMTTGPDNGEVIIPYSPLDGETLMDWAVKRISLRTKTPESITSVVSIEKSTVDGEFSASTVGTVTLLSSSYQSASVGPSLGFVRSGDKIRFNVVTLGTAMYWSIITEISNA